MTDALHTPRLDALLARVRRGLIGGVWLHGAGTLATALAGWLLFAAAIDYFLDLPRPIRAFHGLITVAMPAFLLRRDLLRPLARIPGREGVALLLERTHPGGEDLLVSAVQLPGQVGDGSARPLVARVVERAEERADQIGARAVLDPSGPRLRAATGLMVLAAGLGLAVEQPDLTAIFLERLMGRSTRWPQRTTLSIEVHASHDGVRVEEVAGDLRVRAARGSDLPVLVRAEGLVPREVLLHFGAGQSVALQPSGSNLFRTVLRSIQEDMTFSVTGGDDDDQRKKVHVTVLQPPDVSGVAWSVTPPSYSGIEPFVAVAPDVEVLAGSLVTVHLLPDPQGATGKAHLLPEDTRRRLEPTPFPASSPDVEPRPGLAFKTMAELSMRISFELTDDTGLPNPDPGLFALTVVEDRRPEVLLLAPGRADVDVVIGGALPLRVRVEDDFGISALTWDVRTTGNPDESTVAGELTTAPITEPGAAFTGARTTLAASELIDVDQLGGEASVQEGAQLYLQVIARDVREPVANETPSAPIRIRVVSGDEFLRSLQEKLARASETARRVHELAQDKERLHRDLLLAATSGEAEQEALGDLSAMQHGMRRVEGDARALARDLAQAAEGMLYSRLDARGAALLGALDKALSTTFDRSFHPGPWREVSARYRAGQLGKADLAGTLVEIVGLALDVSEVHLSAAAEALQECAAAQDPVRRRESLEEVVAAQVRAREALDELLIKLGEWDNFQSVLTLTRDILNRQENLIQRTQKLAEDEEDK